MSGARTRLAGVIQAEIPSHYGEVEGPPILLGGLQRLEVVEAPVHVVVVGLHLCESIIGSLFAGDGAREFSLIEQHGMGLGKGRAARHERAARLTSRSLNSGLSEMRGVCALIPDWTSINTRFASAERPSASRALPAHMSAE